MPAKDFFAPISDQKSPPTYRYFNGHDWIVPQAKKTYQVVSPIDQRVLGNVPILTKAEIEDAIRRSQKAQRLWADVPLVKRSQKLHLVADWMRHHTDRLTTILTQEIGKPYMSAKDEIERSADMISYFAHEALSLHGEQLPADAFPGYTAEKLGFIQRVPRGVIAAIAPFNYPINLSVSKIAPALVTGNSVIFKPPIQGSITALHMVRIFQAAGIPDDVLITITGGGSAVGEYIVSNPAISMVTFTGSSPTGQKIAKQTGMIPLLFECGGNNGAIVLDDADIPLAAAEIVAGAFSYAGQRCTAIKYVLALDSVMDRLIPRIHAAIKEHVRMGDPRNIHTKLVGPLITKPAAEMVLSRIQDAVKQGAKMITGGKQTNNYIEPTVLDAVTFDMEIVRTETFGPVVSLIRVPSVASAIDVINDSAYGLQASVFSQDEGSALRIAQKLMVGTIWINGKPQRGPDHFPFLGIKGSGVGVQGIKYSLDAMTRLRPIVMNNPT